MSVRLANGGARAPCRVQRCVNSAIVRRHGGNRGDDEWSRQVAAEQQVQALGQGRLQVAQHHRVPIDSRAFRAHGEVIGGKGHFPLHVLTDDPFELLELGLRFAEGGEPGAGLLEPVVGAAHVRDDLLAPFPRLLPGELATQLQQRFATGDLPQLGQWLHGGKQDRGAGPPR